MIKQIHTLATALTFIAALTSCEKDQDHNKAKVVDYPAMAEVETPNVLMTTKDGVKVYNGGFGSAVVADPHDPEVFYMMTDRGANVAGQAKNAIIIGKSDFAPQIGKFRLKEVKLDRNRVIDSNNEKGARLNGLPNPKGMASTGEIPYDLNGQQLATSADGIDSEALVIAADGTFWISDEYGPHIVHADITGKTIERINPYGTGFGGRKIPAVFANRRANRGMEGLTITPDGKTLVGIMQSPMYNPSSAAVSGSVIIRILTFNIATG